jgi:hypothetical protein
MCQEGLGQDGSGHSIMGRATCRALAKLVAYNGSSSGLCAGGNRNGCIPFVTINTSLGKRFKVHEVTELIDVCHGRSALWHVTSSIHGSIFERVRKVVGLDWYGLLCYWFRGWGSGSGSSRCQCRRRRPQELPVSYYDATTHNLVFKGDVKVVLCTCNMPKGLNTFLLLHVLSFLISSISDFINSKPSLIQICDNPK